MPEDENNNLVILTGQDARDAYKQSQKSKQVIELARELETAVDIRDEIESATEEARERIEKMLQNDSMYFGAIKPDIVSMLGYEYLNIQYEGRPVFEIRSAVTSPAHRNRGYYRKLVDRCYQDIKRAHPNAFVVSYSNNPKVAHRCINAGCKEIPVQDWLRIFTYVNIDIEEKARRKDRVFLFDVQNLVDGDA